MFKSNSCKNIVLFPSLLMAFLLLFACSAKGPEMVNNTSADVPGVVIGSNTAIDTKELFGIEIVTLRSSAAGHMLDFRFRVVDVDKAMPFFRKDIKPYLVDQASGKSLTVPVPAKLGPMRPTGRNPKVGVTYWMFFGNPGLIKPGDKVTIVLGDYKLENLVVEGK